MSGDFRTALKQRRSCYSIGSSSPVSDEEIRDIIDFAVLHTPSAFNSQSARVVLLFGGEHHKFWNLVRETLREMLPADKFPPTDQRISLFSAGHGTVLFYEDQSVVRAYQEKFPLYSDSIPGYSENSAGMLQLAVWTMLRDADLGASLQHYGNLVQERAARTWNLDDNWRLIAQMPFGAITAEPGPKDMPDPAKCVKVFS